MDIQTEIQNQRHWLRQLFSEDNSSGSDLCIAKIMATIAFISYIVYAGVGVHQGHYSLTDFGTGLMTVLFGSAGIITGKNFSTKQ